MSFVKPQTSSQTTQGTQPTTSLFGHTQSQPSTNPLGTAQANPSIPSLFSTPLATASKGLFSTTSTTTPQQPPPTGLTLNTSILNTPQPQQQRQGGLFGGTAQPSGGIFGTPSSSAANQQPQTSTPSLFSNLATPQNPQNTTGGTTASLFGNKPLFGNTATPTTVVAPITVNPFSTPQNQPQQQQQQQQQQPSTSLFGGQQQPQAQQTTSLFGQQQTQIQPTTSLYGQQQPQVQSTASLFGQQQPQAQPTSLYGQPQQQAQTQPTTSLFGQPQPQGQSTTSLFGQPQQTQTQTTTSLFGQPQTQTQPTSSLFGQPQAPQAQAQPTMSLFGQQQPQVQPTSSLFGQQQPQAQSTTSLFGQQQPQAQSTTSLFGQPQTQVQSTASLFGQPRPQSELSMALFGKQQPQPYPNTSLFGQPQQPQVQTATSLFNQAAAAASANNSLFGQSSNQQRPGFGSSQPITSGPLFGSTTYGGSLLGKSPAAAQQDAQASFTETLARIEAIAAAWGVSGPAQCRYQHYFYNFVDPSQVSLYGRPPHAGDEMAWARAVAQNPDPTCLVPVLAVGFDDLQQRVAAQNQQAVAHQEKVKELKTRMEALMVQHATSNVARLHRASAAQTQLTHRLMNLVLHLHLLIPSLRSSAITTEEESLWAALEDIEDDIKRRRVGGGKMRAKLNELWALVSAFQAARDRDRSLGKVGFEWAVVDEDSFAQITQILSEQQASLEHLTKVLQKDMKDLAVVFGTKGHGGKLGMLGSASTMRDNA